MKKITNIFVCLILTSSLLNALPKVKKDLTGLENIEIKNFSLIDYPGDRGDSAIVIWAVDDEKKDSIYTVYLSSDSKNWIKFREIKYKESTAKDIDLPFWLWDKKLNNYSVIVPILKVFSLKEEDFFDEFKDGFKIYSKIHISDGKKNYESQTVEGVVKGNWFRWDRINHFIIVLIISIVFFIIVSHAKKRELFIRRIAGLDAIDEAVGRATEMGKSVIYVPGIGSMSNISTIASVFILGEVSKKIAQYDATIKVPHYDPIVFTVAKETVKQSYIEAERPDSFRDDINMFITQDQFAYAAAIDGMISREKPAACFYMGYFMAESLLLAEVGASTGAIQIAGTDVDHQLPFFVTACDYTLIGEELYAAGAYLSKEPMLVSALKVQDFGKLVFILTASVLSIAALIMSKWNNTIIIEKILDILKVR
ncbi:MAG: hypothetical protein K6357_07480 [Elusimicrobiota bacterium]